MYLGTVDIIGTDVAVASTANVTTISFPTHGADAFGLEFLAASGGDVDVLVKFQASMDNVNFVTPEGLADVINLTDETRHITQLSIPPCKYGRFLLDGQNSNASDTTVTTKLFRQEQQ